MIAARDSHLYAGTAGKQGSGLGGTGRANTTGSYGKKIPSDGLDAVETFFGDNANLRAATFSALLPPRDPVAASDRIYVDTLLPPVITGFYPNGNFFRNGLQDFVYVLGANFPDAPVASCNYYSMIGKTGSGENTEKTSDFFAEDLSFFSPAAADARLRQNQTSTADKTTERQNKGPLNKTPPPPPQHEQHTIPSKTTHSSNDHASIVPKLSTRYKAKCANARGRLSKRRQCEAGETAKATHHNIYYIGKGAGVRMSATKVACAFPEDMPHEGGVFRVTVVFDTGVVAQPAASKDTDLDFDSELLCGRKNTKPRIPGLYVLRVSGAGEIAGGGRWGVCRGRDGIRRDEGLTTRLMVKIKSGVCFGQSILSPTRMAFRGWLRQD